MYGGDLYQNALMRNNHLYLVNSFFGSSNIFANVAIANGRQHGDKWRKQIDLY